MASEKSFERLKLPERSTEQVVLPKQSSAAMTKRGASAAISYMACAVLLIMFNKAAMSSYDFPCANVITLFQMTSSCLLLYAMRYWKIISFEDGEPEAKSITNNPATLVPLKTLVHTLPLALSYLLYMLASMESVRGVSVPMYTTLRRTTVAFTMVTEYLLVGQKHSLSVVCSVAIVILGALVAGARDLSFDSYSYAVVFISNICTAIYLASVARVDIVSTLSGKSSGLNSFGLMWCNGLLCGSILLFWTLAKGDLEVTMNFPHLFSPGFQVVMLLSCILAFLLNYSVFLNTTLNSALTQTICGNLKDLFTIGIGWLLFGGLPFDSVSTNFFFIFPFS
ncbi:UDP-N-acetylglucosamine/UDP-glucose/GDP-mannose transporter like [Actinidia chinensis var. chinensis]|uniref:UDP-N-acetylglucosamine/UDP-glucose/GDP-mannose transporter like n=1 Tax=Actinidia chinensis var. chinensis TaxID=1590841 RepID=A0A2R6P2L1_ACTCC|nr:UDP-N-acetylglucosamine/UDP-glucose/GDP-mannose transporter like [Actinidia chinensis var. chinensis]